MSSTLKIQSEKKANENHDNTEQNIASLTAKDADKKDDYSWGHREIIIADEKFVRLLPKECHDSLIL